MGYIVEFENKKELMSLMNVIDNIRNERDLRDEEYDILNSFYASMGSLIKTISKKINYVNNVNDYPYREEVPDQRLWQDQPEQPDIF